jgi:SOS-response transcriptional repressor LexA
VAKDLRKLRLAMKLRAATGLTLRKFAEKYSKQIGVGEAALRSYSEGRVDPPLSVLIKIAEYTGVTLDYLVSEVEPETRAVEILQPNDYDYLKPEAQAECVPLLGRTAAGGMSFDGDRDFPVGRAAEYARIRGHRAGNAFAVRVRGRSMEPDYPNDSILEIDGPLDVASGNRGVIALVFYRDAAGDVGHAVKRVRREKNCLVLEPINPDFRATRVPLTDVVRVLAVVRRMA